MRKKNNEAKKLKRIQNKFPEGSYEAVLGKRRAPMTPKQKYDK